jgi:hypothetical protein
MNLKGVAVWLFFPPGSCYFLFGILFVSVQVTTLIGAGQWVRTNSILWCQSASKFDPRSASNFDPLGRRVSGLAVAPSELVGVAETARALVGV